MTGGDVELRARHSNMLFYQSVALYVAVTMACPKLAPTDNHPNPSRHSPGVSHLTSGVTVFAADCLSAW
jgi:hypothetical protein